MKQAQKRWIAWLLCVLFVLPSFSFMALATDDEEDDTSSSISSQIDDAEDALDDEEDADDEEEDEDEPADEDEEEGDEEEQGDETHPVQIIAKNSSDEVVTNVTLTWLEPEMDSEQKYPPMDNPPEKNKKGYWLLEDDESYRLKATAPGYLDYYSPTDFSYSNENGSDNDFIDTKTTPFTITLKLLTQADALKAYQKQSIDQLKADTKLTDYAEDKQAEVRAVLTKYEAQINSASSKEDVDALLQQAKAELRKIPSLQDKARYEEAKNIYFEYSDGRIQNVDEKGAITLTAVDTGTFKVRDYHGTVEWKSRRDYEELNKGSGKPHTVYNILIGAGGRYDGRKAMDNVESTATLTNDHNRKITFYINIVPSEITALRAFVDGKEVEGDTTIVANGSSKKQATIQGLLGDKWIPIPLKALQVDPDYNVFYNYGENWFNAINPGVGHITFALYNKPSVKRVLNVQSAAVAVTGLNILIPQVFEINKWNVLTLDRYVGVQRGHDRARQYRVDVEPVNASNHDVVWKDLTPDIAHFEKAFDNGIVPSKAGTARFEVSSVENPTIKKEVSIQFVYKRPLTNARATQASYTVKEGAKLQFEVQATPSNATEQRFVWECEPKGIIRVSDIPETRDHRNVFISHFINALAPGRVHVTGTPFDQTGNPNLKVEFDVEVTPSGEALPDYPKMADNLLAYALSSYDTARTEAEKAGKPYVYGNEWDVFATLRAGGTIPKASLDAYLKNITDKVTSESEFETLSLTDIERVLLAFTAAGVKLDQSPAMQKLVDAILQSSKLETLPENSAVFALLALDSLGSQLTIPADARWNKEKLIDHILKYQAPDGSFSLAQGEPTGSVDMTAMTLQALAPHRHAMAMRTFSTTTQADKVQVAIDKGLNYLRSQLDANAGYKGNSASAAQVIVALTALDMDPTKAEGFTLGRANLISSLEGYKRPGGFTTYLNSDKIDIFGNQQVTYALAAYHRFVHHMPSLYDCSADTKPAPEEKPVNPSTPSGSLTPTEQLGQKMQQAIATFDEGKMAELQKAYEKLSTSEQASIADTYTNLLEAERTFVENHAAGRIYLSIEKTNLGQGYLLEPQLVPFLAGETVADIMPRVFRQEHMRANQKDQAYGYYLAGIRDPEGEQAAVVYPNFIQSYAKKNGVVLSTARDSAYLGEFDYTPLSGWVVTVDNVHSPVGMSGVDAKNDMVVRWAFTVVGYGRDCWDTNSPGTNYGPPLDPVLMVDKTPIIKALANFNQSSKKSELLTDSAVKAEYEKLVALGTDVSLTAEKLETAIEQTTAGFNEAVAAYRPNTSNPSQGTNKPNEDKKENKNDKVEPKPEKPQDTTPKIEPRQTEKPSVTPATSTKPAKPTSAKPATKSHKTIRPAKKVAGEATTQPAVVDETKPVETVPAPTVQEEPTKPSEQTTPNTPETPSTEEAPKVEPSAESSDAPDMTILFILAGIVIASGAGIAITRAGKKK